MTFDFKSGIEKKIIYINWTEKIMKVIFRVIEDCMSVAALTKYLLKAPAIS